MAHTNLLAADIAAPLTEKAAINGRLALVQWLHVDALRRERVRVALKAMPDFARALARVPNPAVARRRNIVRTRSWWYGIARVAHRSKVGGRRRDRGGRRRRPVSNGPAR